jgi:hypothetical protein
MIFRAVSGYDPLSYDTKVGFDVSQLEILFPEEMNAYKRWEKVREAACSFFFLYIILSTLTKEKNR